jgi:DNA replication protein DnaC
VTRPPRLRPSDTPVPIRDLTKSESTSVTCPDCGNPRIVAHPVGFKPSKIRRCDDCARTYAGKQRAEQQARLEGVQAEERRALAERRRAEIAAQLQCPARYADASLETFAFHGDEADRTTQGRVMQLARRYLATWPSPPPIVVFKGAPGSGKGHVAWALVHALVRAESISARFDKLPDLIRALRAGWRSGTMEGDRTLAAVRAADLLVIDDVSTHAFYGSPTQHLFDVLDHRLDHGRPTIMTTNEQDADLAKILRPALYDRLQLGEVWTFGTASFRARRSA